MALSQNVIDQLRIRRMAGEPIKRLAEELGFSKNTVRKYLRNPGMASVQNRRRPSKLEAHREWMERRFLEVDGNAEVIRREIGEKGVSVSLRQVERMLADKRRLLSVQRRATVRFETQPGKQMQIDFGVKTVLIRGKPVRLNIFVATLGYSRRRFAMPLPNQRQRAWFTGIESAFRHFQGVPTGLLVDNASPLVRRHESLTGQVEFLSDFLDFCSAWGVVPKACRPYRARTKGKVENAVKYVKGNALAGKAFDDESDIAPYLEQWCWRVDRLVHGTTHEVPADRFEREERAALLPIPRRPP